MQNKQLPNTHFRKEWDLRVRTWFNQPGRKLRRRRARVAKAAQIAPRPTELLRPAVRCPTVKYNRKVRVGRGFTFEELKAAGIGAKYAATVGIAVDHRRRNRSEESLALNVQRLKAYQAKLIVLPRNPKHRTAEVVEAYKSAAQASGQVVPVPAAFVDEAPRAVSAEEKKSRAYVALRQARGIQRSVGKVQKRIAFIKEKKENAKK
ncbi:60S ribosomal protein L13 [Coemansia sp. RSA 2671]|uniref:60S ribosomal protein L13 n=1 Tax=Coemansia spiralis TaxID=417178 RepID=A0A9W8GN05_9FUNG|nr:60S ribosomal protein L13 [Coemansia sp. RSA 2675]KAJ2018020.1 60S ribosomal protein L13 [Coemansia sp. S85]KAJ2029514.1 60S ribosomal protein L13 [Coemansia sp. S610]KAJ2349064.1 60S ribosomal protein L13 [Coemansia sp. RSA 2671]KAJ2386860.1 60S ribosomal protein L13 [Coemansia sp. RSA 2611]KAJ2414129.1 60S ribosomal protein L13 [Coemansia sp. RSA 2530]KAJ2688108.1 60S ribosomal protein L13 [Coemansia spiralis]KAJ2698392.1 60S ribosomal protein L13 [Coemansia sp. IMI 209128]